MKYIDAEKQLLLKDLCARLPYGVQVSINDKIITTLKNLKVTHFYNDTNTVQDAFAQVDISDGNDFVDITSIKPYLRPMSSMTDEERQELKEITCPNGTGYFRDRYLVVPLNHLGEQISFDFMSSIVDWLNKKGFDYRGLIPKGLAFEAPEGMYK